MSKNSVTRRQFLGAAAAFAAPAVLPASLIGPAADRFRKVDEFFAGYFGCSTDDLHRARTIVVTHKALAGYDGVLVFRHGPSCIVSVPDTTPQIERSKLQAARPVEAFDRRFLSQVFLVNPRNVRGPASVGVAVREDFKPVRSTARVLGDADEPAIRILAERCGEADWMHSKVAVNRKPLFGLFEGGTLVAIAGYIVMENVLAYTGVVTPPDGRGKGYGKAVVSAAMNSAYENGLIPLYRSMIFSRAAIAVGRALGFQPYASTIDLDLEEYTF